ncbi:hypothetical protein [Frigidibacter sp. MR17.24]|uniref:hypothetical protein n=1 Tax=Frigidibacter sp. MR17.24 TaxID=3127345 RepID=UPI003012BB0D
MSRGVPFAFFAAAAVSVTLGMAWGIQMGIAEDFMLAPAHAHLNLVGWVTLALFGIYYRMTPAAAARPLARIHAGLAILGVALFVPGIALSILGAGHGLAIIGSLVSFASMLVFLVTVLRHGFGAGAGAGSGAGLRG